MKLLQSLVFKTWKNGLNMDLSPDISGLVKIYDITDNKINLVSEGYLMADWQEDSAETILERMHEEVDGYLSSLYMEEDVSFYEDETEDARARLTSYERKMKEAGVKESDFL